MTASLRHARRDDTAFLYELVNGEDTHPFLGGHASEDVLEQIERSEREPDAFGLFVIEVDEDLAPLSG